MKPAKKKPRGRPFPKGVSPNPGGRPRGLVEFRLAARAHSDEALRRLLTVMRGRRADPRAAARIRAIRELFDRAWGRPVQELAVQGSMAQLDLSVRDFSHGEVKEIARRLAFLLARGAHGEKDR